MTQVMITGENVGGDQSRPLHLAGRVRIKGLGGSMKPPPPAPQTLRPGHIILLYRETQLKPLSILIFFNIVSVIREAGGGGGSWFDQINYMS